MVILLPIFEFHCSNSGLDPGYSDHFFMVFLSLQANIKIITKITLKTLLSITFQVYFSSMTTLFDAL
jgi:hypothetical protein